MMDIDIKLTRSTVGKWDSTTTGLPVGTIRWTATAMNIEPHEFGFVGLIASALTPAAAMIELGQMIDDKIHKR